MISVNISSSPPETPPRNSGRADINVQTSPLVDLTHPDSRRDHQQQCKRLHRGEVAELALEKRYVRKDGRNIWVLETSTVLRDAEGKPQRQVCVIQDTTERKAVELELAQRTTQLQLAVEAAELGTFFNDEEAGIHVWNEQNKRLLGLLPDASPSMETFLGCVHPDDRARVERKLRSANHAPPRVWNSRCNTASSGPTAACTTSPRAVVPSAKRVRAARLRLG